MYAFSELGIGESDLFVRALSHFCTLTHPSQTSANHRCVTFTVQCSLTFDIK